MSINEMEKVILVIDDSLTIRKFIEKTLLEQNFVKELIVAPNLTTGMEIAKSVQPNLIISDLTLSDGRGDVFCVDLLEDEKTASIPVILMSSNGQEIQQIKKEIPNVASTLMKPFSRELLIANTCYVLDHVKLKEKRKEVPVHLTSPIRFRGNSSFYSLTSALHNIEKERLTGIFQLVFNEHSIYCYCQKGAIRVVSTRDVDFYVQDSNYYLNFLDTPNEVLGNCIEEQKLTSSPFLINMADHEVLAMEAALTLTEIFGRRMFARVWSASEVEFQFEDCDKLPPFVQLIIEHEEIAISKPLDMEDWILETLRFVESSHIIEQMLEDPNGVPSFKPEGYQKLESIRITRQEESVIASISSMVSLEEISKKLSMQLEKVALVVFRFRMLGLLDFWPSDTLKKESNLSEAPV